MRSGVTSEAIAQADRTGAVAVAVDAVGEAVFPQRKQRAQLRAQLALGLVEKRREGVGDLGAAEALEELHKAALAEPDRGNRGARVASHHLGEP